MTTWPYTVDTFTTKVDGETVQASHVNAPQSSITAIETEEARTYRPDLKPAAPSAYDDEFETLLLDPKWTAINCASGTVDLLSVAAAADTYDAATYQGMMALQPGRDAAGAAGEEAESAMLRQTISLAANCKIIAKINSAWTVDAAEQSGYELGLILSGVAGFNDANYVKMYVIPLYGPGGGAFGYTLEGEISVAGAGTGLTIQGVAPNPVYLMIMKTGNDYSIWVGDGHTWGAGVDGSAPDVVRVANANALTRLSLYTYFAPAGGEVNLPNPISTFDFVRYFTNNTPLVNA